MLNHMSLNKGQCVVCSAEPMPTYLDQSLSEQQLAFFNVPDGRTASWRLCENHFVICHKADSKSGFPNTPLLIDAISNAVSNYDFSEEIAEEKRNKKKVKEHQEFYRTMKKHGIDDAANKAALKELIGLMESLKRSLSEIIPYWIELAELEEKLGFPGEALSNYLKAIDYLQNFCGEESTQIGKVWLAIGMNRNKLKQFHKAKSSLESAVRAFEVCQNPSEIAKCYEQIGHSFFGMNDKDKAKEFFKKAEKIS